MSQFVSRRTALAAMAAGVATVGLPGTAAAHAQEGPHSTTGPDSTWVLPGDQAAKEGDPEADEVVKQLVGASQMTLANQVFHAWTRNDQPVPAEAPPVLRDFLQRNTVLTAQEKDTVDRLAHGDTIKLVQSNMEVFTMAEAFGGLFVALADPLLEALALLRQTSRTSRWPEAERTDGTVLGGPA